LSSHNDVFEVGNVEYSKSRLESPRDGQNHLEQIDYVLRGASPALRNTKNRGDNNEPSEQVVKGVISQ